MSDYNDNFSTGKDQLITDGLREIYAAPASESYWSDLEARILSRIAEDEAGLWWVFLGRWVRAGAVAAVIALVAAGLATLDIRRTEAQVAYRSVLDDSTPVTSFERVSRTPGISEKEAAFRYVFSY